jgi:hypothetical protein
MRACGVHTYSDYLPADREPGEYELKDALTINVTRFYRNPERGTGFAGRGARPDRAPAGPRHRLERRVFLRRGGVHPRYALRGGGGGRGTPELGGPDSHRRQPTSIGDCLARAAAGAVSRPGVQRGAARADRAVLRTDADDWWCPNGCDDSSGCARWTSLLEPRPARLRPRALPERRHLLRSPHAGAPVRALRRALAGRVPRTRQSGNPAGAGPGPAHVYDARERIFRRPE